MALPTGPAVTFLFTDIEGSTRLERSVGSAAWAAVVGRHDDLLATAIEGFGGVVVKTEGDAFFAAFAAPTAALTTAVAAQRALAAEPWTDDMVIRVRMGLHVGEGRLRTGRPGEPEDYVGIDVNYTARIAAAANGGQVLLSDVLVAALPAALVEELDVELRSEGPRAVKDFDEPLPLYRLVIPGAADDTRPLRTSEVPSNLPGDVTTFVGREDERAAVRDDLEGSRIVTLTGPGGTGKTRLAVAAARDARDRFPHGVWLIELAAIRDPSLLEPVIAAALGVRESADRPVGDALRVYLREGTALLLLDNLEQLLPEAARTVARIVRDAPSLRVIVTSRELLRITGERSHPVPPLDLDAGVALFLDRARGHRPDLVLGEEPMAAVRAIAARLGGLPLALELAAARTRLLSPAQILDRLEHSLDLAGGARDLPERQRTLRGAIDWSYELLSPEERRLFARLGVFASGWTAEAAEAVANGEGDLGIEVVEGLESLADKSLVRLEPGGDDDGSADGGTRFGLHPLLREYALERLEETGGRPSIERAFVTVYAEIADDAGRQILGQSGDASMRRLDREDRNLRAAVEWTLAHDDADDGLRIMGATWRWFQRRGRLREGRQLVAQLLEMPVSDPRILVAGLAAAGGLAYWMDDFAAARTAYDRRLELAMATGDAVLMADAHYDLGFMAMVANDEAGLRTHEQRALDLYLTADNEMGAIRARQALVLALFLAGDYLSAAGLETQNLEAFRRAGSRFEIADSLTLLSGITWRSGDPGGAWARLAEGLRIFAEADSSSGIVRNLGMAAIIQLSDGDAEFGARIAGATYRLVRDKGVMLAPVKVLHLPDPADLAMDRFGAERAAALLVEGDGTPLDEIVAEVLAARLPTR